mgnify:CR=1 FL=1
MDRIDVVRWRSLQDEGLEHCVIRTSDTTVTIEGGLVSGAIAVPYGLRYRLVLDAEWGGTRSIHVTAVGGATLALRHDGYGQWSDASGQARGDLAGARDVDVPLTPLTAVLPMRRLGQKAGKTIEVDVVAIDGVALTAAKAKRKITRVETGRLSIEAMPDGPVLDWTLDERDLPRDCAGLFARI